MLIRCQHCFTPFTLNEETIVAALDQMEANNWKHYNAYCPRCGKANIVSREQLMSAAPESAGAARPVTARKPVAKPPTVKPKAAPAKKKAPAKAKPARKPAKKAAAKKPATKKSPKLKAKTKTKKKKK